MLKKKKKVKIPTELLMCKQHFTTITHVSAGKQFKASSHWTKQASNTVFYKKHIIRAVLLNSVK